MRMILEPNTCVPRPVVILVQIVTNNSRAYFERPSDGVYATNENNCLKSANIRCESMGRKRLSKKHIFQFLINPATHCVSHTIASTEWIFYLLLLLWCVVIVTIAFQRTSRMRCECYMFYAFWSANRFRWTAKLLYNKNNDKVLKEFISFISRERDKNDSSISVFEPPKIKKINVFLFSSLSVSRQSRVVVMQWTDFWPTHNQCGDWTCPSRQEEKKTVRLIYDTYINVVLSDKFTIARPNDNRPSGHNHNHTHIYHLNCRCVRVNGFIPKLIGDDRQTHAKPGESVRSTFVCRSPASVTFFFLFFVNCFHLHGIVFLVLLICRGSLVHTSWGEWMVCGGA